MMPLSEHEQRLLDEIEQALYAEDPKFASSVRAARAPSRLRRSWVLGVVGAVVGLGLVLIGLLSELIFVSVIGFVLVVGCAAFVIQCVRTRRHGGTSPTATTAARVQRTGGLRSRMEERMRRRFDES